MPFWKRDPELQAARAEAEASLPPGWKIYRSDSERFRVPAGHITTYGICAVGPSDQTSLVIAVGEANTAISLVTCVASWTSPMAGRYR